MSARENDVRNGLQVPAARTAAPLEDVLIVGLAKWSRLPSAASAERLPLKTEVGLLILLAIVQLSAK